MKPGGLELQQASSSWRQGRVNAVGVGVLPPAASGYCRRGRANAGGVGLLGASPAVVPVKPGGMELQPAGVDLLGRGRPAAWDPDGGGGLQQAALGKGRQRRAPTTEGR